jgi:uncharacterized membrane protein
MTSKTIHRDQTGFVGKIAVVWLLIGVLLIVGGFDGVAILFTKYRVQDLAGNAASEAAIRYKASGRGGEACQAAATYVEEHDAEAHIPAEGCRIDAGTGVASITVRKVAGTLVAQRLSFTKEYTRLESTESVEPPL